MEELIDYSGTFDPHFTYDRFTKETLIRLLGAYGKLMHTADGLWYLTVMDKLGMEEAYYLDEKVLERLLANEIKAITRSLSIHGDDVATVMKYLQMFPIAWLREYGIDLKNEDHAVVTYSRCTTLSALEKEGLGREEHQCRVVEQRMLNRVAHHFNPRITVTPLKVPPRADYSDCCCQWEFKLGR